MATTADNAATEHHDALVMVYLRNAFYKSKYRLLLCVYLLSILVITILLSMLVYLLKHPPHPLYFVADHTGRLIQEIPVQQPNMSNEQVAGWATEAVEAAYSYNFVNYRAQLQDARKYFTDSAWGEYMKALTASNNLLGLTQRRWVVIAKAAGTPKLLIQGPLGKFGAMAWKFEIPVLVTYINPPYDDKSKVPNAWLVTVIVQRQNILESYKGLSIVRMIGSPVSTSIPENLAAPPI